MPSLRSTLVLLTACAWRVAGLQTALPGASSSLKAAATSANGNNNGLPSSRRRGSVAVSAERVDRRRALLAGGAAALSAPGSALALANRDMERDTQIRAASGAYGVQEDAPFRDALSKISQLLDNLGVEGAVQKSVDLQVGPPIERSYLVGLRPGTDRLRACDDAFKPDADVLKKQQKASDCVSSTRLEKGDNAVAPFVYFDQKGDAVGMLLEKLYSAADAQLLTARGNFFNGAGVYVLAELTDKKEGAETLHDVEFQFLPGVLENVVDVRIVAREGPPSSEARQRFLLDQLGTSLGWIPLKADVSALNKAQLAIFEDSTVEMDFRNKFEGEMEKADAEMQIQMRKEAKRIDELKAEVKSLLDSISRQEKVRMDEYAQLRSRTAQTREDYEAGVNKRIGGVANNGRYGAGQSIKLGNSFAGLINSQDDVTSKVYKNIQQQQPQP